MKNLNEEQKQAIKTTEGYVRVVAGAGSGKTKVLTTRYVYLAKVLDIAIDNILSVTFTNKAAKEMKSRIQKYLPDENGNWIMTFHGACHKILKEEITHLSYPSNFIILDEDDQKTLLEKIYKENDLTVKDFSYKKCLNAISWYKTHHEYVSFLTDPENKVEPDGLSDWQLRTSIDFVIKKYLVEQRKNYYLDFDDLISFTLYLFSINQIVKEKWQDHFEYIQVDEFQDVSMRQYELVKILSDKHKNLFIVGDPDQTIYSWRGADVDIFLGFSSDFPSAKTILLTKNYRSSPEILNVSNSLIKHNTKRIEKDLSPVRSSWAIPQYYHAKDIKDESDWITEQILKLQEGGASLNDIAILYRANTYSRNIEEALMRKHIPYALYSGYKFYQRWEIKTALSYLRMLAFADDISFERTYNTPARGIGKKKKQLIDNYAKANDVSLYEALKVLSSNADFGKAKEYIHIIEDGKSKIQSLNPADLLDSVLKSSGLEQSIMLDGNSERLENLNDLKNSIKEYVDTAGEKVSLADYLNDLSLLTDTDKTERQDTVKMMTVHTAKGLEFPYVFVCGLNEGIFPSTKVRTLAEMEEERRIAYVAYTRAQSELFLSDAAGYNNDNQLIPSRFIFDISPSLIKRQGQLNQEFIEYAKNYIAISEKRLRALEPEKVEAPLKQNDIILHNIFGKGKILQVTKQGLKIKFKDKERTLSTQAKIIDYCNCPDKVFEFAVQVMRENKIDLPEEFDEIIEPYIDDEILVLAVDNPDDYKILSDTKLIDKINGCLLEYDVEADLALADEED
ncbi:MAG: UvrD-helicase domain-containing protein [Clostridia bacterium]|nr:UvrD-helicase domain-containing protein [Clostridia bacterium]